MSRRNLTEKYKKEVAKKAIRLKEKNPELTWTSIVKRLDHISSPRHLRSIIEKYEKSYYKKE